LLSRDNSTEIGIEPNLETLRSNTTAAAKRLGKKSVWFLEQLPIPVRVRGTDKDGKSFEEIAHTLDISATSSRVGAIRRQLKVTEHVTVVYRQRRTAFLVVWTKLMGTHEYQVGLQAVGQEKEAWGLNPSDYEVAVSRSGSRTRLPASREAL
jgi:hypothetical protein